MHSRSVGGGQKGEGRKNSSRQSWRVSAGISGGNGPREQGAETHCGMLSIASGGERAGCQRKEDSPFSESLSLSLQRLLYALSLAGHPD